MKHGRGKKRQEKAMQPGAETYQLTMNAKQMVQGAPQRFLRLQLARGGFAATYDKVRERGGNEAVRRLLEAMHTQRELLPADIGYDVWVQTLARMQADGYANALDLLRETAESATVCGCADTGAVATLWHSLLACVRVQGGDVAVECVFAKTTQAGFAGVALEDTGYESWEAMADACEASRWAKQAGTSMWVLFPNVAADTGTIDQFTTFDARALALALIAAGAQLGYEPNRWGTWAIRKKGTAELTEAGRPEDASMWLGHADPNSRAKQCYVRGARNFEVGNLSMGRDKAELHLVQFAGCRVRHSEKRRLVEVPTSSRVYCDEYEHGQRRVAAIACMAEINEDVCEVTGQPQTPSGRVMLTAARRQALVAAGREALLTERNEAQLERNNAERQAISRTLVLERKQCWRGAQQRLTESPQLQLANERTEVWPVMSEAHAVAWSLARPDFTRERVGMRLLPEPLSEAMLDCGAIGLLHSEDANAYARGNGLFAIEKSGLFTMSCGHCENSVCALELSRRTMVGGRAGRLVLRCPECGKDDAMQVASPGSSVTAGEAADAALKNLGKPLVDRRTYAAWRRYDGDLYSGGAHTYSGVAAVKKSKCGHQAPVAEQPESQQKRQAVGDGNATKRQSVRYAPRRGKLVAMKVRVSGGGAVALTLKPTADRRKAAVDARRAAREAESAERPAVRRRLEVEPLVPPPVCVEARAATASDVDAIQLGVVAAS